MCQAMLILQFLLEFNEYISPKELSKIYAVNWISTTTRQLSNLPIVRWGTDEES